MRKLLNKINELLSKVLPSWLPADKVIHFSACFVGAFIEGKIQSITLGVAIGKEVGDYFNKESKFSIGDLIADGAGIISGLGVHYAVKTVVIYIVTH